MVTVVRVIAALIVLCACGEVLECKHYRRADLHRIVIKPKRKAVYKKPSHHYPPPQPQDYHHYQIHDEMFDPYHAEPNHHHHHPMEPMEDIEYMPSYHSPSYSGRYREPEPYKDRTRYSGYKPYVPYQHFDFDGFKPGYQPDYKTYKDMMEEYNRKQEDEFRRQVEKAKLQMYSQAPQQEAYQYAESQERPMWNAPEESGLVKGDWSPMSHSISEPSFHHHPSASHNIPTYETSSISPQTPPTFVDYTKLDMTTSKPYRPSQILNGKNSTKYANKNKVNYNFGTNYFPNHKPEKENDAKEIANKEKGNDFQASGVVSTSYSTIWGSDQKEAESNTNNKHQSSSGGYGTKTKIRRTKRPAYGNH